jgi:mono/diheme cytochrome c family protein
MRRITKFALLIWVGSGITAAAVLAAQSQQASPSASAAASEPARQGQGLFLQNCALCHFPTRKNSKNMREEGTTIGPRLDGRFNGPKAIPEAVARTFIQKGVQGKMPGFGYALSASEIDDIIVYLKSL